MVKTFTRIAIAAAALAGFAASSQAALIITITDLDGGTITCNTATGGVGCTGFTADAGQAAIGAGSNGVTFSGTVGNFIFTNSSFFSNAPGTATALGGAFASGNTLNLNTNAINQSLTISVVADGFTAPAGPVKNLEGTSSQNGYGSAGGTQSYSFGVGGFTASCGPVALVSSNGGCGVNAIFQPVSDPFTLSLTQTYFVPVADNFLVGSTVSVTVPEPMSTALVGTALVALALTTRRRKSSKA